MHTGWLYTTWRGSSCLFSSDDDTAPPTCGLAQRRPGTFVLHIFPAAFGESTLMPTSELDIETAPPSDVRVLDSRAESPQGEEIIWGHSVLLTKINVTGALSARLASIHGNGGRTMLLTIGSQRDFRMQCLITGRGAWGPLLFSPCPFPPSHLLFLLHSVSSLHLPSSPAVCFPQLGHKSQRNEANLQGYRVSGEIRAQTHAS